MNTEHLPRSIVKQIAAIKNVKKKCNACGDTHIYLQEDAESLRPVALSDGTVINKAAVYFKCKSCRNNIMLKSSDFSKSIWFFYLIGLMSGASIAISIIQLLDYWVVRP